jgi:hypothetical protein
MMNQSCQWDVDVVFSSRCETNLIVYGLCKGKILGGAKDMPADSFAAQTEVNSDGGGLHRHGASQ